MTSAYACQMNDCIVAILDDLAPAKTVTKRRSKQTADWLSKEAAEARRVRRKLERRYRRTGTDADRRSYRSACRSTNRLINQSRREHIQRKLQEATGDCRKRWRIANELLHKTDQRHQTSFAAGDGQRMCNSFSKFFTDKVCTIRQTISDRLKLTLSSSPDITLSTPMYLDHYDAVTELTVKQVIDAYPPKFSPLDLVPLWLIKQCNDIFSYLICRLVNMSFAEGVFPEVFKTGQVTPLIKKAGADINDPANYRPITNLNSIGKILEKLAQKQLMKHISSSVNCNTLQSAYRAFHSTETAVTKIINDLLLAVDCGQPSILLSLDISAAFDTLDHERLLKRATEVFGLTGHVREWLRSYLCGRTTYVSVGGARSCTTNCATGVPQGSVLGPLLFSLFTTPVGHLISSYGVSYHQYADDTQLYTVINSSSPSDLQRLSYCAEAVTNWHLFNGLLLNPAKTEALVTGSRQQVARLDCTTVKFADTTVNISSAIRVLGVTIDSHLTFDKHVTKLVSSCNYHIRSLRHIRQIIDRDTAMTLACSSVMNRLDYCNAILYGVTNQNILRLQRVENRLARVVCSAPYRSPSAPLLQSLHWLPVSYRITYKIAMLTFKTKLHHQPIYLFTMLQDYTPSRQLRSSSAGLLKRQTTSTKTSDRAFSVAAVKIWNDLPLTVRSATSAQQFARRLKTHLFALSFD